MIDYSKYENKITYPNSSDFTKYTIVFKNGDGALVKMATEDEARKAIEQYVNKNKIPVPNIGWSNFKKIADEVGFYVTKDFNEEEYKAAQLAYGQESSRLGVIFMNDALKEVGLQDHPNAYRIYWYAYERGHSGGYEEVFNCLQNVAHLFE